jgi:hypothetical protein
MRTFNSQVRNVKDCSDSFEYKSLSACSVNCYALAVFILISVLLFLKVSESVFAVRFASQRENYY